MKKKVIFILSGIIIVLQLALGTSLLQHTEREPLDTILINDMVKSFYGQWEKLEHGEVFVQEEWKELDYTILSGNGTVLASMEQGVCVSGQKAVDTNSGSSQEISEQGTFAVLMKSIKNRDTMVDIGDETRIVGKLLIHNRWDEQIKGRMIFCILMICMALETALVFITFFLIKRNFIQPFQKLQEFAVHVAGGALDFPLQMDAQNVFGAFTESFDLMREELKKARFLEREANRSKKELVAKLSHDIKTPVASIQAISELMLLSARQEKEIHQLTTIKEKSEQIDGLISDLFHATLEELQELSVMPEEQSSLLLQDMICSADYQNLAVLSRIPECMVIFDKIRLQQVLDNIFSNSYKYADTPISVSFVCEDCWLCMLIEDRGPGVSKEECPLLFEKYYRGKNGEGQSGAGLGLFISHYLTEQMGGLIYCANTADGFQMKLLLRLAGSA